MGGPSHRSTSGAECVLCEIVMLVAEFPEWVVIGMQFQQHVRKKPRGQEGAWPTLPHKHFSFTSPQTWWAVRKLVLLDCSNRRERIRRTVPSSRISPSAKRKKWCPLHEAIGTRQLCPAEFHNSAHPGLRRAPHPKIRDLRLHLEASQPLQASCRTPGSQPFPRELCNELSRHS
jgi:hypothetical protein